MDLELKTMLKHLNTQVQSLEQMLVTIQQNLIQRDERKETDSSDPSLNAVRELQMRFDILEQSMISKKDLSAINERLQEVFTKDQIYLEEQLKGCASKHDLEEISRQLNRMKQDSDRLTQQLKQLPNATFLNKIQKMLTQKLNRGTAFFLWFIMSLFLIAGLAFQRELNQLVEEYIRLFNTIL